MVGLVLLMVYLACIYRYTKIYKLEIESGYIEVIVGYMFRKANKNMQWDYMGFK